MASKSDFGDITSQTGIDPSTARIWAAKWEARNGFIYEDLTGHLGKTFRVVNSLRDKSFIGASTFSEAGDILLNNSKFDSVSGVLPYLD